MIVDFEWSFYQTLLSYSLFTHYHFTKQPLQIIQKFLNFDNYVIEVMAFSYISFNKAYTYLFIYGDESILKIHVFILDDL